MIRGQRQHGFRCFEGPMIGRDQQWLIWIRSAAIPFRGAPVSVALERGHERPLSGPFAKPAMTTLLFPVLSVLLLLGSGLPSLAEQRGGPNSGGSRPQTPAELSNSDNPCGAQLRPCGW